MDMKSKHVMAMALIGGIIINLGCVTEVGWTAGTTTYVGNGTYVLTSVGTTPVYVEPVYVPPTRVVYVPPPPPPPPPPRFYHRPPPPPPPRPAYRPMPPPPPPRPAYRPPAHRLPPPPRGGHHGGPVRIRR